LEGAGGGNSEKGVASGIPNSGRLIKVRVDAVVLPNGKRRKREVVVHRGAVAIIAVEGGKILMERQYRHTAGKVLWEIPAGTLEEGEEPERCARRELEEETGYVAGTMRPLIHLYVAPGYSTEVIQFFMAGDLRKENASPDEDEAIEAQFVGLEEAHEMVRCNVIEDGKSIIGILLALEELKR
jgi:ADP-ribose pyrophosphatase